MKTCPKCGYTRTPEDATKPFDQCPSCGVYYAKAERAKELQEAKQALAAELGERRAKQESARQARADARAQRDEQRRAAKEAANARTTQCKDCGGTVSKNAETCPHCGAKVAKQNSAGAGTLALLTLIVLATILFGGKNKEDSGTSPRTPPTPAETAKYASGQCERLVKNRLKSPSTADFPWGFPNVIDLGGNEFMLVSYVDAQNGFGAMIRSNYSCRVKVENGKATITDVNIQ
ncbi:MAG: hypothetical protein AB1344_07325 [Pseudomonadota bacterium]